MHKIFKSRAMYLDLFFCQELTLAFRHPWLKYIFLSQYCASKCLVWIRPKSLGRNFCLRIASRTKVCCSIIASFFCHRCDNRIKSNLLSHLNGMAHVPKHAMMSRIRVQYKHDDQFFPVQKILSIKSLLGLIRTRHFDAQYCEKKLLR